MNRPDVLIVGGGVVGLTVAHCLVQRDPGCRVLVIDKEARCGEHASGRNSGVLHAGFYYAEDSLKAQYCVRGNRRMKEWCQEHGVRVRHAGKLVVATVPSEDAALDGLFARGQRNGVDVQLISRAEALEIEPRVRTHARALWSPSTASVEPREVMAALVRTARDRGIEVRTRTAWTGRTGAVVHTTAGDVHPGFTINAAGLYADRVAAAWGVGGRYRIVPFKGLYLLGDVAPNWLRTHVYPVPPRDLPFLGVHFTVTAGGGVQIGPTALPAWWRENYDGLANFRAAELLDVVGTEARMFARDPAFRRLAMRELPKVSRRYMARKAAAMVRGLREDDWRRWGHTGIRAQLLDTQTGKLAMDFVVQQAHRSLHVLNAVSPAFTCSWPFAEDLAEQVLRQRSTARGPATSR